MTIEVSLNKWRQARHDWKIAVLEHARSSGWLDRMTLNTDDRVHLATTEQLPLEQTAQVLIATSQVLSAAWEELDAAKNEDTLARIRTVRQLTQDMYERLQVNSNDFY